VVALLKYQLNVESEIKVENYDRYWSFKVTSVVRLFLAVFV